jgi:uncharacterized protein YfaT (DUF1175 family)
LKPRIKTWWLPVSLAAMAIVATLGWGLAVPEPLPVLTLDTASLPADGNSTTRLTITEAGAARPRVSDSHIARIEEVTGAAAQIRAGILPGRVSLAVGRRSIELTTTLSTADSREDGTPDFLRLDDEHDRQAFRRWFTYLAEAQYFQAPEARPAEINDCAALIRYAYREALHAHDSAWAAAARLPVVPALDTVAKYQYPYTPLGAALFRVRPGAFRASDLTSGAFTQFADAQTLWRLNSHFVSRRIAAARPGDLLFFRQETGDERFHSMIYVGESQIRRDGERYFVYHTGPRDGDPGEIRRLSAGELTRFPQAEWRPLESNAAFLGVYRWNIL